MDLESRSSSVPVSDPQPIIARLPRSLPRCAGLILPPNDLGLRFPGVGDEFNSQVGPIPSGPYQVSEKGYKRNSPRAEACEQHYPAW